MAIEPISIGAGRSAARWVGRGHPVFLIAEIGQNHNGSLELAEQLVDAAAWAGVDAVKLVKRDLDCELTAAARARPYDSPHAFGPTYGQHRQALELSAADHARLFERARRHGLACVATACDIPSAQLLQAIDVDAFKIASRDLSNDPLISFVASLNRPLVLSTGMSTWAEIDAAVETARRGGSRLLLMHCTSLYPTPFADAHLRSLPALAARYDEWGGFSDHSPGILLAPVAAALGAVAIEKHITLDRTQKGTDHACSLEPDEFRQLVQHVRSVELALGRDDKPPLPAVAPIRARLGRSLVARTRLNAGAVVEEPMLVLKSPGDGIAWSERALVVGRRLARDVEADEQLALEDLQ
jgi:sialic acid synthase